FEKTILVGQCKHAFHKQFRGFRKALSHQFRTYTAIHLILPDCERTYFGKSVPADMKRAHTDEHALLFIHMEITQVLIELIQGAWQHLPRIRVLIDEYLYRFDIFYYRFSNHKKKYYVMR